MSKTSRKSRKSHLERQRKYRHGGRPLADTAVRTCQEVADIMTANGYPMGEQRVRDLERAAIWKLRTLFPELQEIFE